MTVVDKCNAVHYIHGHGDDTEASVVGVTVVTGLLVLTSKLPSRTMAPTKAAVSLANLLRAVESLKTVVFHPQKALQRIIST